MAYRFLLEVPETLSADANTAVASTGDAQVLVNRNSHGLGFDDPYNNLTVAAQSLAVVDVLYTWADEIGATRSDSRLKVGIVLHSGERLNLHDMNQPDLIAAIRRDQPWVERSVPKIGDHEPEYRQVAVAKEEAATATALATVPNSIRGVDLIEAENELVMNGHTYAVIQVYELPPGESFYHDVFGLDITLRLRQEADESWGELPAIYDHDVAVRTATEADVAFMVNDPLRVALVRAGRAVRLDYGSVRNDIAVLLDSTAANRLKALVLMRGYTLLTGAGRSYSFRDPFGVVWDIQATD